MLPTLKYGPETDEDWAMLDTAFLNQAAIVQIITSLETYYQTVLKKVSRNVKISEIDAIALSKFIKENKLMSEFTKALETKQTLDFYLSELVPEFFPLQQKEKIRIAMNLIGLDPVGSFLKEWERTFGDEKMSTIKLRHTFVHEGISLDRLSDSIIKINMAFIKERIKDAILLVGFLENQICEKYPAVHFKELYPKTV
jgi:hypothetical protein